MTKHLGAGIVALLLGACGGSRESTGEGAGGALPGGGMSGSGGSAPQGATGGSSGEGGLAGGGGEAGGGGGSAAGPLVLTSDVVQAGEMLPATHRCDGPSPPLSWSGGPEAASYALILVDVTPGFSENFPHWVLYDVPGDVQALPADIPEGSSIDSPVSGKQGPTWNGTMGYEGPCALSGTNTYRLTLHAVDVPALPTASAALADVDAALAEHSQHSVTLEFTSMP